MSTSCLHVEVGWKPQLSPRGGVTKGAGLKSLPTAAYAMDLYIHHPLCKFSTGRTSEWTMDATAAEIGLVLAAVDFVGACLWGPGRARI